MTRLADIGVAIQEWIVAALSQSVEMQAALGVADAAGAVDRIWDSTPPEDADLAYVEVNIGLPADVGTVGLVEVMARAEVTVKAVGRVEAYEPINPIAVAIHHALQAQANVPVSGGGVILSSQRLRPVAYPEQTGGIEYRHLGGTYEVFAQ